VSVIFADTAAGVPAGVTFTWKQVFTAIVADTETVQFCCDAPEIVQRLVVEEGRLSGQLLVPVVPNPVVS
jgi:hypothetical protein